MSKITKQTMLQLRMLLAYYGNTATVMEVKKNERGVQNELYN